MNGGYIMIKASDADIYLEASRALTIGKPILFYENDTTCYYIDTIILDGTNIVLTKGGKTITIANDNTITSVGDIQNHLYQYNIHFYGSFVDAGENTQEISFAVSFLYPKDIDFVDMTYTDFYNNYSDIFIYNVINGAIYQQGDNIKPLVYNNESDNELMFINLASSKIDNVTITDEDDSTDYITVYDVFKTQLF